MAVIEDTRTARRTYGNWRRPTSPGLMGLGSIGTVLLLGGLVLVVITVMVAGLWQAVTLFTVMVLALALLVVRDRHGRSLLSRIGARTGWWAARSRGAHLYSSGPLGRALWGTFQLPGLVAATRLSEHTDSYGRRFALLYTPASGHYSVVLGAEPDGAALVDQEQIDAWVADWGHWLANLGDEPSLEAASVTIETAPDTGTRLRREVMTHMDPSAPEFARAMLTQAVERYPAGSSTVKAYVALTFTAAARAGAKKRTPEEMGHDLAARLPGLTQTLSATGAGASHPLTAQELCEAIRGRLRPGGRDVDRRSARGG
ncbi:SCO6880 family protein [Georgenia soli]|uniref:SCO6880 family protein n=1 Tax=Georgenia soli TaxID=638953 RepID=UPI00318313B3